MCFFSGEEPIVPAKVDHQVLTTNLAVVNMSNMKISSPLTDVAGAAAILLRLEALDGEACGSDVSLSSDIEMGNDLLVSLLSSTAES